MKKSRNRVFTPYLARARARAPGPLPQVGSWASGPLPQGGVIGNPQGGRACGFRNTFCARRVSRARGRCFFRDFDSQRVVKQLSAN